MAFIVADRVKETTNSTGTGAYALGGAAAGFQTFSAVTSNTDTVYYAISDNVDFEVGVGTYASSGNSISRTTILSSSNSGSAVNWGIGTKDIFLTYPAEKAVVEDLSNNVTIGNNLVVGGTVDGVDIAARDAVLTSTTNTATAALPKAGGTMSGNLILNADPTIALQSATKQYVDTIAAAGIHYHQACRAETTANLNATYSNGSSGVGATLTNAGTQAAIVLDGVTLSATNRVMVQDQTNQAHNGVYTVTTVGSASTNWVLTRATDADSYSPSDPDALGEGDAFFITEGTVHGGELDVMTTTGVITFGTTNIVFALVSDAPIYTAGTGMSLSGTEFSIGQAVATSSTPTFAGLTTTADVSFGDSDKAVFGAGSDLEIYHSGNDSFIRDAGAGDLYIRSSSALRLQALSGENYAVFTENGSATFYYDNAQKLATTSTGIDVTGTITANDLLNIESTTGFGRIEVGGPSGAFIDLKSPFSDDFDGRLHCDGSSFYLTTNSDIPILLKHNNAEKMRTTSTGVTITGTATATTFSGALSGNASTATALATGRTIGMTGDVVWTSASFDGSGNVTGTATIQPNSVALGTDTTGNYVQSVANGSYLTGGGSASEGTALTLGVDATNANTASKVVARDGSGNFSAGTVTAALSGNASTATTLATARTINGVSFNGAANITVADSTKLPKAGGAMTGAITTNSTFDGRNVSVDGAKLDGIASGATNVTNNNQLTNGAGYTTSVGDITNVSAGTNLTGGGSSGSVTLNVTASPSFTDVYVADQIFHTGDTNTYMQFHAADQWRVVTGGSERLEVNNSATTVAGTFNNTSDARLKENVAPLTNALSDVCKLEGVSFNWIDSGKKSTGFIAQQVEPILPDVVTTSEDDGIKSVNYVGMIGHLVEAIKEQQAQIDALTAKLNG